MPFAPLQTFNDLDEFILHCEQFPEQNESLIEALLSNLEEFDRLIDSTGTILDLANKFPNQHQAIIKRMFNNSKTTDKLIGDCSDLHAISECFNHFKRDIIVRVMSNHDLLDRLLKGEAKAFTAAFIIGKVFVNEHDIIIIEFTRDFILFEKLLRGAVPYVAIGVLAQIYEDHHEALVRTFTHRQFFEKVLNFAGSARSFVLCKLGNVFTHHQLIITSLCAIPELFTKTIWDYGDLINIGKIFIDAQPTLIKHLTTNKNEFIRIVDSYIAFEAIFKTFGPLGDLMIPSVLNDQNIYSKIIPSYSNLNQVAKLTPSHAKLFMKKALKYHSFKAFFQNEHGLRETALRFAAFPEYMQIFNQPTLEAAEAAAKVYQEKCAQKVFVDHKLGTLLSQNRGREQLVPSITATPTL